MGKSVLPWPLALVVAFGFSWHVYAGFQVLPGLARSRSAARTARQRQAIARQFVGQLLDVLLPSFSLWRFFAVPGCYQVLFLGVLALVVRAQILSLLFLCGC